MRLQLGVGIEDFLFMTWTSLIQNHVADHHQKLLAFSTKPAREWILTRDVH